MLKQERSFGLFLGDWIQLFFLFIVGQRVRFISSHDLKNIFEYKQFDQVNIINYYSRMGNAQANCVHPCQQPAKCKEICRSVSSQEKEKKLRPILFENENYIYPMDTEDRLKNQSPPSLPQILKTQFTSQKEQFEKPSVKHINEDKNIQTHTQNIIREVVVLGSTKVGLDSMVSSKSSKQKIQWMEIPFEVIKLTLDQQLVQQINKRVPDFFLKQTHSNELSKNWRLTKSGAYINFLSKIYGTIITRRSFYEGYIFINEEIQLQNDTLIPDTKGIFICRQFTYEGQISVKKANGKGSLVYRNPSTDFQQTYEGNWQQGKLVNGNIKTKQYEYCGDLLSGRPHGKGELLLMGKDIRYQGRFQFGLFNDIYAQYDCSEYSYKGSFKNGHKNGQGVLKQKQNDNIFEGNWIKDKILVDMNKQQ